MSTDYPAEPTVAPVPLDERLNEATLEERQRALRALLQHPLITADGPQAAAFGLVRRYADELREWFGHHLHWSLQVTSEFARLRKTPPDHTDRTRAALDARTESPFTRGRYVLLCLALAALERSERQTTLGKLAEAMFGFFAADSSLVACGLSFELKTMDERRDLVQVIRFLLECGVLRRVHGDEEHYLRDDRSDVLYTINRPVLTAMVSVRRGPSTISATDFEECLEAIVEEPMPDSEDGQNRQIRVRLMRRLVDDPVLYYEDLESRERTYLDRQRGFMLPNIREATGMVPEIRAEGIALLDHRGEMTDLGLPEEGTEGHLTLLIAEHLADALRADRNVVVGFAALCAHTADLIAEHRHHWRKDVTAPGADRVLTRITIARLEALRLVRKLEDGIRPLPAIARYGLKAVEAEDNLQQPALL
jgi:uncharacterized protein (TIGR02678 family)